MTNIAFRSLFLEASWNARGQQNLGLGASLEPAIKRLYPDTPLRLEAKKRSLAFFNTNPVFAGLAIGVALNLEEALAGGDLDPKRHARYMRSLGFALASLGDAIFWQAWLPLCSLISVWGVISLEVWWAPFLLPLLFGLLALPARLFGLYFGYKKGPEALDFLDTLKISYGVRHLKRLIALFIGVSTTILVATRVDWTHHDAALPWLWGSVLCVAFMVFTLRYVSKKTSSRLDYWFPLLVVSVAIAVALCRS